MRAILIDPFERTVTEVEFNGDWRSIKEHIGNGCDLFWTGPRLPNEDTVYVDDEGLFKSDQEFFQFSDYPEPLAGRGLVLGTDERGDSVEVKSTLEEIRELVTFVIPARVDNQIVWLPN